MKNNLIIVIITIIALLSCEKEPEEEKKYGYISIYTNAPSYWSGDSINVNIYIDGEKIGVLNQNYNNPYGVDVCDTVYDSSMVIKRRYEVGTYHYSANFYYSAYQDSVFTSGTFLIEENICKALGVFISRR